MYVIFWNFWLIISNSFMIIYVQTLSLSWMGSCFGLLNASSFWHPFSSAEFLQLPVSLAKVFVEHILTAFSLKLWLLVSGMGTKLQMWYVLDFIQYYCNCIMPLGFLSAVGSRVQLLFSLILSVKETSHLCDKYGVCVVGWWTSCPQALYENFINVVSFPIYLWEYYIYF